MNSNDVESNRRGPNEIAIRMFTWRMSSFQVTVKYKAKRCHIPEAYVLDTFCPKCMPHLQTD